MQKEKNKCEKGILYQFFSSLIFFIKKIKKTWNHNLSELVKYYRCSGGTSLHADNLTLLSLGDDAYGCARITPAMGERSSKLNFKTDFTTGRQKYAALFLWHDRRKIAQFIHVESD